MNHKPHVSVIIPTYNRAAWLAEAMSSVRAQTYTDYELIIADDGSNDNTAQVAAQWAGSEPGPAARYLRLAHSGRPAVARNRALARARGRLVAFLDDDDVWMPRKLERQVRHMRQNPDAGLVYGDVRFRRADGSLSAPVLTRAQKRSGNLFSALLRDCFIFPSTVLVRRDLLQAAGGFDEELRSAEDYGLWLRLAHAAPVAFQPEPHTIIRRHQDSFSHRHEQQIARDVIRVLDALPARLRLSPRQRLLLRRRRARARTHLALLVGPSDRWSYVVEALRLNPLQIAAWRLWWRGRQ
ncbi:MAG TPA: glycosyltransferase [Candidatus Sulfomarinibacteraceae bacterium]|nr:glycosyltransferase [Candidatus Sulfomarinibacteraceae bacterium]